MASTYPTSVDTFITYQDNVNYVLSSYANSWTSAITAIQNTLGAAGTNPLSSPYYSTFNTVSARLNNIEETVYAGGNYTASSPVPAVSTTTPTAISANGSPGTANTVSNSGHTHAGVSAITTKTKTAQTGAVTLGASDVGLPAVTTASGVVYTNGTAFNVTSSPSQVGQVLTCSVYGTPTWAASTVPGDIRITSNTTYYNASWRPADGTSVSRTSYPSLFTALTICFTATISSSTNLTSINIVYPTDNASTPNPLGNATFNLQSGWAIEFVPSTNTNYPTSTTGVLSGTISTVTSQTNINVSITGLTTTASGKFYVFPNGTSSSSSFNLPNYSTGNNSVLALVRIAP